MPYATPASGLAFNALEKQLESPGKQQVIAVEMLHKCAACELPSSLACGAGTAIRDPERADLRMGCGKLGDRCRCVIGRTIVDDDDLDRRYVWPRTLATASRNICARL